MRAALAVFMALAAVLLLIGRSGAQSLPSPQTCALTSSNTSCTYALITGNYGTQYANCTVDSGGTWSGQLDFQIQGLNTPAPASGNQPGSSNTPATTTTNGLWTFSVTNATSLNVIVDTPGSFTGTANVGIRCAPSGSAIMTGSRAVSINCPSGSYPCGLPTPIPTPAFSLTEASASVNSCHSLVVGAVTLDGLVFSSSVPQTGILTFYNEGGSPGCWSGDAIYVALYQPPGMLPIGAFASAGLAYEWTQAAEVNRVLVKTHL